MSTARNASNMAEEIKGIAFRDAGNVLVSAAGAAIRDAGSVLRQFFTAFAANVSETSVSGIASSPGSIAGTTSVVTALPVGGVAPFTYAWTILEEMFGVGSLTNPTGAATAYTSAALPASESAQAVLQCTITDANGAEAITPEVTALVTNIGG